MQAIMAADTAVAITAVIIVHTPVLAVHIPVIMEADTGVNTAVEGGASIITAITARHATEVTEVLTLAAVITSFYNCISILKISS